MAPLLAERVTFAEAEIYRERFSGRALEETLLLELHGRICGDLTPDWAGKWRAIKVRVGRMQPPPAHRVALEMREYCLNLQARYGEASEELGDLTLEFLSYAEGRFLAIHPFQDFNGRTVRLFLLELLRRLDLPRVVLASEGAAERAAYFAALEAADQHDFQPLAEIWRERFNDSVGPQAEMTQ